MAASFEIVGRTDDAPPRPVLGNVFWLADSAGIPLEVVVAEFEKRGFVIAWLDFYDRAIGAGWKRSALIAKIQAAVGEVHGREHCEIVMAHFERFRPPA